MLKHGIMKFEVNQNGKLVFTHAISRGVWEIVTKKMMKGVVCLHEGVWPSFDSNGIDTAGSVNILTSTVPTKPSYGSRTHSTLVEVKA